MTRHRERLKLLAVSSGGGHWVQLRRIDPAFERCEVVYVTVLDSYREQVPDRKFYWVNDATRWNKFGLVVLAARIFWILAKERPDAIISTGAAPGYFALRFGRWFGARTLWLDSIANVDSLSLSGARVGPHADLWLTQWEHLAKADGPRFEGAVI